MSEPSQKLCVVPRSLSEANDCFAPLLETAATNTERACA